ncbi:GNAT family N-acetyltransferase [Paenibacillus sp. YN15]|uniref:GNAT family N-acetyltransferase n=1 Tax=Paenibacillus sp. YN15 TaxID=1742774 RepID=UPI0015ECD3DF|nr:GNAT family N-acetyltransferase [Paenibacillus sp. YN15]
MIKHGLIIPDGMTERQIQEVRELAGRCAKADSLELKLNWGMLEHRPRGTANDFLWYERGKLVGFLALYHFVPKEAEVGGMVHPDFRQRGIFSALTEAALQSARKQNIPALLFACPRQSASAKAFVESRRAVYAISDYGMKLVEQVDTGELSGIRLARGVKSQRQLLIRLDSLGFDSSEEESEALVDMTLDNPPQDTPYIAYNEEGEAVGRISSHIRDGNAHFFCFSVVPQHRRKGYGRQILLSAISLAKKQGLRSMTLEVACNNAEALTLYHRCGFRETYINDYYRLDTQTFVREEICTGY